MSDWELIVAEAIINESDNPSVETNTTGWSVDGVNFSTITRVGTEQKFGAYSAEINVINGAVVGVANAFARTPNVTVGGAESWTFSLWYKVPSGNDGVYEARVTGYASQAGDTPLTQDGAWHRLDFSFTSSGGGGLLHIRVFLVSGAVVGAEQFYLDAVQYENSDHTTTYCDGDQPGCEWLGAADNSTSQRSAQSRAGGRIRDFKDDFGFGIANFMNTGMPTQSTEIDNYALLPGGQLNDIKIEPREFTLMGTLQARNKSTPCALSLDELRADLEEELAHDRYPEGPDGWQPILIRYTGADVQKEIACHYSGGLEGRIDIDNVTHEKMGIRFVAPDPLWYEIGQSAQVLDTEDSATFRIITARLRSTGQWDDLGPPNVAGVYTAILDFARGPDGIIYIVGDFTNWDNNINNAYVTSYNPQTGVYTPLGVGLNGIAWAVEIGPDGTVYVAGAFTDIRGGPGGTFNRIAFWNGAWNAFGVGADANVQALAFGLNGHLYAGGAFANIAGVAATRIAFFDGAAWNAMGAGIGEATSDIAVHPLAGDIYPASRTAGIMQYWDVSASAWVNMNTGAGFNNVIDTVAFDHVGLLYLGGMFTTIDGITINRIATFNGQAFAQVGAGITSSRVRRIRVGSDGMVFVGGGFTDAGGLPTADHVVEWNGSSYIYLDVNLPGAPIVNAFLPSVPDPMLQQNYDLWVGFTTSGASTFAGSVDATNEGTAHTFANFIVERSGGTSASLKTLRNETIGRELQFAYGLLDGEKLTTFNHPLVQDIQSDFWGQRLDATLAGDDFGDWSLQPGDNQVTCFVDNDGATIVGYLLWRDAYLGHGD